jgi:hypothetical protein
MACRIELYRPSNGTEGESFMGEWCYQCRRDTPKRPCSILTRTMAFDKDDKQYPTEWRYVGERPVCTAFVEKGTPVVRTHKPGKDQQELFQ